MKNRTQSLFKFGLIALLALGFGVYGLYRARGFLEGTKIIIDEPRNGQVFQNSYIDVMGRAKNITSISLNNRQIFIDENGKFRENLLLGRGYNIIEMQAQDKFGRNIKVKREVILK